MIDILGSFQDRPPCCFAAPYDNENPFPTLEKGGKGGFEMDGQPIESLSISLLSKGRGLFMPFQFHSSTVPQFHSSFRLTIHDSRYLQDRPPYCYAAP